jgi:hypothetical protein
MVSRPSMGTGPAFSAYNTRVMPPVLKNIASRIRNSRTSNNGKMLGAWWHAHTYTKVDCG